MDEHVLNSLRERRSHLEKEVSKLKKEAAVMYLEQVTGGTVIPAKVLAYEKVLDEMTRRRSELKLVDDLLS